MLKYFLRGAAIMLVLIAIIVLARSFVFRSIEHQYAFTINVKVAGDFTVVLNPTELTLTKGETGTIEITNTASGGFDAKIGYGISGLPEGSYSFSKNPVSIGEATTLTINTSALASNTTYVCKLVAQDQPATSE